MDTGCYSIVVKGESDEYHDSDSGDTLIYSGTRAKPGVGDAAPQMTNATKSLIMSLNKRNPVRVIRRGPNSGRGLYPACGFRYDGLYRVVERIQGNDLCINRFKLIRLPDQPPLAQARLRPTRDEYRMYKRIKGED